MNRRDSRILSMDQIKGGESMKSSGMNLMKGVGAGMVMGAAAGMLLKGGKKKNAKQMMRQAAKTIGDVAETVADAIK